jgi:hypothetical protein
MEAREKEGNSSLIFTSSFVPSAFITVSVSEEILTTFQSCSSGHVSMCFQSWPSELENYVIQAVEW